MAESVNQPQIIQTTCCVVGGGPAGVMAGFLLARAGVDVLVLEKHKDFFRDFRGDTIHPSTLELLYELGLLEEFLELRHERVSEIQAHFGDKVFHLADFSHLPTHCKFVAFMPQWDFLNFLTDHAHKLPKFALRMEREVTGVVLENDRVVGIRANTPAGPVEVRADLVIGADGRGSTVRQTAGLEVIDSGAPIDVLWFRIPKKAGDPPQAFGFIRAGQFMVLIDRADYWQIAYIIRKGSFPEMQRQGLDAFRREIARCAPFLGDRMGEIRQWDDVKLLAVKVDHLRQWYRDGLLCIGDSAHAMSPVGGVGINLAIQDAVAVANMLAPKLAAKKLRIDDLKALQHRREWPARMTQRLQIFIHKNLLERIFESSEMIPTPVFLKLTEHFPQLRRLPARAIGIGFRPEHIAPASDSGIGR